MVKTGNLLNKEKKKKKKTCFKILSSIGLHIFIHHLKYKLKKNKRGINNYKYLN